MTAILLHVQQQVSKTCPGLDTAGNDLASRENEAVGTSVTKLGGECVLRAAHIVGPVDTATGGLVDGAADRSGGKPGAVNGLDSRGSASSKGHKLGMLSSSGSAGVSVS